MGNNPSSHHPSANYNSSHSRTNPTSSAPATPTGTNHQTLNNNNNNSPSSSSTAAATSATTQAIQLPPPTTTFVDGGYLFPLSNIYPSSPQDWLHPIVQHLILSRRLAPFYRGLEDWEEDWDRQMIAHALQSITLSRINSIKQIQKIERQESIEQQQTTAKYSSGSISRRFAKNLLLDHPSSSSSSSTSSPHQSLIGSSTLNQSESNHNHNVRHQIFEAILNSQIRPNEIDQYLSQTVECPICFLYYPPNINLSRCCQQPICTECFTQIKRTDPTPQEIKSEPACCPYCVESNFGVTYVPPALAKRTDWSSPDPVSSTGDTLAVPVPTSNQGTSGTTTATTGSQSAPSPSGMMGANMQDESGEPTEGVVESTKMKRRQTTSHTSTEVVTTDSIQPDWQAKLEAVKAAVQRRANRRIIFRQEGDRLIPVGITSSRDPNGSAFLAAFEQDHNSGTSTVSRRGLSSLIGGNSNHSPSPSTHSGIQGSATGTVRRHRTENSNYGVDLEELMIMEAMRLSLAEEEERKKKAAIEEEKIKKMTETMDESGGSAKPTASTSDSQSNSGSISSSPSNLLHPKTSSSTPTPTGRSDGIHSKPPTPSSFGNNQGGTIPTASLIDHPISSSPHSFSPLASDSARENPPPIPAHPSLKRPTPSSSSSSASNRASTNPFLSLIDPTLPSLDPCQTSILNPFSSSSSSSSIPINSATATSLLSNPNHELSHLLSSSPSGPQPVSESSPSSSPLAGHPSSNSTIPSSDPDPSASSSLPLDHHTS
ncbi:uncharacterized protein PGTG_01168 [Puccinia graminis f. sp. tritici CRL 75-36-700-3]|uniref:SNF1-interacting protein n=1 Tax=Puccinia graminis f. sp. tritici (strain CRL 75-36-700-3 / race SCCL) TaxID=418459 RepID=E3JUW2_PUCGT|nr:uncharacterized protein PGTG_01168 [Puccinia graminis f. sp. tritici CRL 75-36-700-3]EFP75837.1 hypothetical protein PGTG_01168 [Puccinia graminis f. sp. tritici CRL 75-36-700-3]